MRAFRGRPSSRPGVSGARAISVGIALTVFCAPSSSPFEGPQTRRGRPSARRRDPPCARRTLRPVSPRSIPLSGNPRTIPPKGCAGADSLLCAMRLPVPLAAEIAAARAAGRLSRLAGAGGGTTVPGKLLWKLDPGAVDRLAARLPLGSALVSATNGKTTTAAMAAEILRPRVRLAHNRSGANLVSGIASTLLATRDAELGLFEVDEGALGEVAARVGPRVVCLGNLFRDQLDRYGELELVAERWRETV